MRDRNFRNKIKDVNNSTFRQFLNLPVIQVIMDKKYPQSFFHSDEMHKFVRRDVAGKSGDIPWRKLKTSEKENAKIKKKEKQSQTKMPW